MVTLLLDSTTLPNFNIVETDRLFGTNNRPSSEHKIQTKLSLANPYANIEGQ